MTFAGDIVGALPEMQAAAESLMKITFRVYVPGEPVVGLDGYETTPYTSAGLVKGKLQATSAQGGDTNQRYLRIGGVARPVLEGALHIPISARVPVASQERGVGWEYEISALDPDGSCRVDPALVPGRRFLVVEVPAKSFATARRLSVVEV